MKRKEWFWGVVLALLLAIGCVEANPGPRHDEANHSHVREHYGAIERNERHLEQEVVPSRFSVCWPFMFWCKNEPLPDEEGLLGRQANKKLRNESDDDELLQIDPEPAETTHQLRESELRLEINLLNQQVQHLNVQLEAEIKQRHEERKHYEDTIAQHRQTQEESRRLCDDLYTKLNQEISQKKILEQQILQMRTQIDEEKERIRAEFQFKLEQETTQKTSLEEAIYKIKNDKVQYDEEIKITNNELQAKLDAEISKKKTLEEKLEQLKLEKEKCIEETKRICIEFQEKLNEEMTKNKLLEQQLVDVKEQYSPEEKVDKLNKEFQRRKQLEEELVKEIEERKHLAALFKQETSLRQQLEEELRQQSSEMKTMKMEYEEMTQEQEIQRRQLQHGLEQEKIQQEDLLQQLEHEIKQKQDLFRRLIKETEERHIVELQLQEEIQVRRELELELKQADLQSQILEQELRQQLQGMERIFKAEEDEDIEVIEETNKRSTDSDGDMSCETDETIDKSEEMEGEEDIIVNDDEEKQEIRQLLLEEFERLQIVNKEKKMSEENVKITTTANDDSEASTQNPSCSNSLKGLFLEEGINEINLSGLDHHKCSSESINKLISTNHENEALGEVDAISRGDEYLTMTMISEHELHPPDVAERRKGILIKRSKPTETSADDTDSPGTILRYNRALLKTSQSNETEEDNADSLDSSQKYMGTSLKNGLPTSEEHTLECDSIDYPIKNKLLLFKYSDIFKEKVTFQGREVLLSTLIGETILPQTEVVLQLFQKLICDETKPIIGTSFPREDTVNYIPRHLSRKTYIKSDIFKHKSSRLPTAFAVSGMSMSELKELIPSYENVCQFSSTGIDNADGRFIWLHEDTAESEYKDICEKAKHFKAMHWLAKTIDGLIWKQSKGSIDVIRNYIDHSKTVEICSICDVEDNTIILTGDNGSGKSKYLVSQMRKLKDTDPSSWNIMMNADDFLNQSQKSNITKTDVIDFLLSKVISSENSNLESLLLKHSLEITGNVFLLVDEINFKHRDKILGLLNVIKQMKIKKLLIATHTCLQENLENTLSTFALNLKPMSKEQLCGLLLNIWETKGIKMNKELSFQFAEQAMNHAEKSFNSKCPLTPLHINMLALILEEELLSYQLTQTVSLCKYHNRFELYEKYIQMQSSLYYEKNDSKNKSYYAEIICSAVMSLFPEDLINYLFSHLLETLPEDLEDFKSRVRNTFSFLNQDLRDYILAKWFTENYKSHKTLIEETYFEKNIQAMWRIFDCLLATESQIHLAVLDTDIEKINSQLCNGSDVNSLDRGGRTPLHLAVLRGKYDSENPDKNTQIVSALLQLKADISIKDHVLNWSALSYADRMGLWSIVEEMMKTNINTEDMMFTNRKLQNTLFLQETLTQAAINGYIHLVAYILDTGIDINMPLHSTRYSHQQYGLLHIASENDHVSLVEFLLDHGARANSRNWDNSTPLHLACKHGQSESVKLLLQKNAVPDLINKNGDTPLHEAVREAHSEIVKILLDSNADADICNKQGETPLHIACRVNCLISVSHLLDKNVNKSIRNKDGYSPLDCAIREGHTALVKYMLEKCRQCLTIRTEDDRHPLHLTAMKGDVLMLEYLTKVVPEVDVTTVGGDTPLHLASLHGNTDATAYLLKMGANVNGQNNYGNTALHLASLRDNVSIMNILLDNEAEVNICNSEGNTPLHLASMQGKINAVECLLNHLADVSIQNREKNTALQLAVEKGNIDVVSLLIDAGSDVNVADRYGNAVLHHAVKKNNIDITRIIIDTEDCQIDIRNSAGDSPLLIAARSGYLDIVTCLAHAGADLNLAGGDGNAPLHVAVVMRRMELVNLLTDMGADVNVRNCEGNTPLHKAVYLDNETMLQLLVNKGADKGIQNCNGDTPFDVAVQLGSSDSVLQIL